MTNDLWTKAEREYNAAGHDVTWPAIQRAAATVEALIAALRDMLALAESYERNRENIKQALQSKGWPYSFLQSWDAKSERARALLDKLTK